MKRVWVTAIFFSTCVTFSHAQKEENKAQTFYVKGIQYLSGNKVLKDINKANEYLLQAANLGSKEAMLSLGSLYSTEQSYYSKITSIEWYEKAAALGETEAYTRLGLMYSRPNNTEEQDFEKATEYFKIGAYKGNVNSQNNLGYCYYKGLGVEQSYEKAFTYFSEAAKNNNGNALYFLGLMYRNGYYVTRNNETANEYFIKAQKADNLQKQAKFEMESAEAENPIAPIISPEKIIINSTNGYNRIKHNLTDKNLQGNFEGYAIRYDWSGKYIISIFPLKVTLNNKNGKIEGIWNEGDDIANISAVFTDQDLRFSNTQYKKIDHYSKKTNGEVWQFNNAKFNLLKQPDSLYILGNIQLYSPTRKEPGKPLYVHLSRAITKADLDNINQVNISYNNPVHDKLNLTFTLPQNSTVSINIRNAQGQIISTENAGLLVAGTYNKTLQIPAQLSNGAYLLEVNTQLGKTVKKIIKQ